MLTLKSTIATLALMLGVQQTMAQVSFGEVQLINNDWQFAVDINGTDSVTTSLSNWRTVNLPHDWSIEQQLSPSLASCTGFLPGGIGKYKKSINIPSAKQGEKVFLYFEGVYNRSRVYVNGELLGYRPSGYTSFMYDATPYIRFGQDNDIEVVVDHSRYADSRWYTGSGIYRNVWLITSNNIHIAQWGVFAYTKSSSDKNATIHMSVELQNETNKIAKLQIVSNLKDAMGKVVASAKSVANIGANAQGKTEFDIAVAKPHLWNINDPYLYTIETQVIANGKEVDKTTTQTGIRTITFDPNTGLSLNSKNMKLKGVCLHHDAGVLGAAVPREVWADRLATLKQIGCNAIRMSHNPQAPALYELCDEMGFLVLDEGFDEWEFAKRKWLQGWNVGTPGFDGSFDFFYEWSDRDITDLVRRDRNHPSIFAWSIGNEVDYPNDPYSHPILDGSTISQPMFGGYQKDSPDAMRLGNIAKRLATDVRTADPSRPVSAALAGVVMSNETEYPSALDIAGYNYTEDRYDIDHQKYPNRVIYGSENRHDMDAWKAIRDNKHIFGQFLWTGIDYLGESGTWPARGFYSGLISFDGQIKPRGLFRQALWSEKPVISIGTYPAPKHNYKSMDAWATWNYTDSENIRVVAYTNAAQAKLLLNGKEVGKIQPYDDATGIISWDIPFVAGKLEAVALDANNNELCRTQIQTSLRPAALKARVVNNGICKNRGVAIVRVSIVDENDIPVVLADDMITCTVSNNGKLLGLEAGNNTDMTDYTDNQQRAFRGELTAYIEACGADSNIEVTFSAPWLSTTKATIIVE